MSQVTSRSRRRCLSLACLVGLLPVMGCGGEPLTPVVGSVTVGGKPLTGGTVDFYPASGSGSSQRITGTIDADGNYKMTTDGKPGVPKGSYKVTVNTMDPPAGGADPSHMPAGPPPPVAKPQRHADTKYETPSRTDLTIQVPSDNYDLKLTR